MRPLTLVQSADLLGRYRHVELAAFSLLGRRATSMQRPDLVRYVAGASMAHGWRARIIEERLPVSVGLPGAEASARSPSQFADRAIEVICADGPDDELLGALVQAYYPAMLAAYDARLAVASSSADGAIVRTLRRVRADLDDITNEGRVLLGDDARRDRAIEVEALVRHAGGPFGPLI